MANTKISALTSATTPLAGTEVLPIVQSGATVKVAVSDLTVGRDVTTAALTSTISSSGAYNSLQINNTNAGGYVRILFNVGASGANGVASVKYVPGTFFAVGPESNDSTTPLLLKTNNGTTQITVGTDSNVTLSTGNLVIGTSGKGIDFSATSGTGTSELLNDYETGTWTPVAGRGDIGSAGSAITAVYETQLGKYTKVGNLVTVSGFIGITSVSAQGSGNNFISGLPFAPADNSLGAGAVARNNAFTTSVITNCFAWGSSRIFFVDNTNSSSAVSVDWKSGLVNFTLSYFV